MKEDIEEFKKRNGNITYTNKEIVMGIAQKIDNNYEKLSKQIEKVNDKLNKGTGKIAENRTALKYVKWGFAGMATVIGFIAKKVFL